MAIAADKPAIRLKGGALEFAEGIPLPLSAITHRFAFLAQSGAGKSYAAMKLAESIFGAGGQIIALDPVGIWFGLRSNSAGDGPGLPILILGGDRGDIGITPQSGGLVADLLVDRGVSAVLDISEFETSEYKRFVRDFAERFYQRKKRQRGPVHIFFEEMQLVAPQNPDRDDTVMLNRVERLCRVGRNYGVGWSAISQRPQDCNKKVINQAGTLVALRTMGTHERRAVDDWVSDQARNREELSAVRKLPNLPTGTAVMWSPHLLDFAGVEARILPKGTFDSSSTPEFGETALEPRVLAPVEIERLREEFAELAEEVREHDPEELRREISRLREQLASRKPAVETKVVERTVEVEVPVLGESELGKLEDQAGRLSVLLDEATKVRAELEHSLSDTRENVRNRQKAKPQNATPIGSGSRHETADIADDSPISSTQRKLLAALAPFPQGRSRKQLALIAGYSSGGGAFQSAVSSLRRNGYIEGEYDSLRVTASGFETLGEWEPLPTGEELQNYWLGKLSLTQRRLLKVLLEAYPEALTREKLAARAGYEPKGGGFQSAVSHLRALALVEGSRELRASDELGE